MTPSREACVTACEERVGRALVHNPVIRVLSSALAAAGCPLTVGRHISCERCDHSVRGAFDAAVTQVVICANTCHSQEQVEEVLSHELVHMYDHCTAEMDFKQSSHLACTEIRAANLTACKSPGLAEVIRWRSREDCVKQRAAHSVHIVTGASHKEAAQFVAQVFQKCYADLEPLGKISRRNISEEKKLIQEWNRLQKWTKEMKSDSG